MIKLTEIKKYIEKSENPLIFYDDDQDGLCSYLLIKKKYPQCKGYIVKAAPNINEEFLKIVKYRSPDLVIILDIPIVSQEFIDNVQVPIIWIDHHPPMKQKGIKYFNPRLIKSDDGRPTTHWCYQLTNENLWIAIIGIIADWHFPEFMPEFNKKYPEFAHTNKKKEKILFDTELGKLIRYFSFMLKGKQSDIEKNIKYLETINSPEEIMHRETDKGKHVFKYAHKIDEEYKKLLHKALKHLNKDKLFVFTYKHHKFSFTGELANYLIFSNPDKVIIIGRENEDRINISIRSESIPVAPILKIALQGIDGTGGGHELACGGNIAKEDFQEFIKKFKKELNL